MSEEQALDELDLLIQEYDPEQSDWRFRKSVMMQLIERIRPATLRRSADSAHPPATDIVERLRAPVYINKHFDSGKEYLNPLRLEAADEIERLRALPQTVSKLEAEIGMLREKLSDALASGLPHKSDCAVYSAPAHEPGPCDCGVGASFDDGAFDLALKLRQHNGWVRVVSDTDAVNLIKSFIASRCQADSSPQSAPSDDLEDLVARFSKALLAKLKLARANGRSGWEFDDWEEHCQAGLLRHLARGDPRDVAAYCAFMWHHGWATKAADRQSQAESVLVPKPALDWLFGVGPGPDGKSFDDDQDAEERTPRKYSRRYWWRSKFSSMIPALTRPQRDPATCPSCGGTDSHTSGCAK